VPGRIRSRFNTPEFKKLQAKWYKKLRKSGFIDIECGVDLNKVNGQTLPQGRYILWDFERADSEGMTEAFLERFNGWNGTDTVQDMPKYRYYEAIIDYGQSLEDDRTKKFLLMAVDVGPTKAARKLRMSQTQARDIWSATLEQIGLPRPTRVSHEPPPEPAPVRTLTKAEIKRLQYTAPMKIKDRT
jgi:hypothetical protein